jgi:hypothetical protein
LRSHIRRNLFIDWLVFRLGEVTKDRHWKNHESFEIFPLRWNNFRVSGVPPGHEHLKIGRISRNSVHIER